MPSTLTAVIVGSGFIGPVHVEGLRRAGVAIAGIVGSSPAKSHAAAARLGLPRGYSDLDEALNDKRVDVVHLTTPNRYHLEQASAVLRAGKHLLCEKPLAMNSRETAELVRLAQESGRASGVCYNMRFYPLCVEAADRVRQGEIGELHHVTGYYAQDWLSRESDFSWRVLAEEGGELRAMADIGTHWLDLIQFITGRRIQAVCADLRTIILQRQRPLGGVETFAGNPSSAAVTQSVRVTTEDYGAVLLRFDGGGRGVVWVSQLMVGKKNCLRFELAGSKQTLAWESERPNELWIGHRERANELLLRDPALLSSRARSCTDYPGGHNEGFSDTFKQLFRAFYEYIAAGDVNEAPTFPTFADAHQEALLCEAVLRSARQGCWAEVKAGDP